MRRGPTIHMNKHDKTCSRAVNLTLLGCLPSYDLKPMAQAAVRDIAGVRAVAGRIELTVRLYPSWHPSVLGAYAGFLVRCSSRAMYSTHEGNSSTLTN